MFNHYYRNILREKKALSDCNNLVSDPDPDLLRDGLKFFRWIGSRSVVKVLGSRSVVKVLGSDPKSPIFICHEILKNMYSRSDPEPSFFSDRLDPDF